MEQSLSQTLHADTRPTPLRRVCLEGKLLGAPMYVPGIAGDPTWTDAGDIVYARRFVDGHTELWQVSVDKTSSNRQLLRPRPGSSDFNPDWSSSAGLVFVRSTTYNKPGTVMVRRGALRPAAGISLKALNPAWAPHGTGLAFMVGEGDASTLWTRPAGVSPRRTSLSGTNGPPAWGSR